jgi:hypothetical protein
MLLNNVSIHRHRPMLAFIGLPVQPNIGGDQQFPNTLLHPGRLPLCSLGKGGAIRSFVDVPLSTRTEGRIQAATAVAFDPQRRSPAILKTSTGWLTSVSRPEQSPIAADPALYRSAAPSRLVASRSPCRYSRHVHVHERRGAESR